jgi:hypothetical protein
VANVGSRHVTDDVLDAPKVRSGAFGALRCLVPGIREAGAVILGSSRLLSTRPHYFCQTEKSAVISESVRYMCGAKQPHGPDPNGIVLRGR